MTEYRYPPFLRAVIAVCLAFSLVLAAISWLFYQQDGAILGLYMLPIWLLLALYWAFTLATMPRLVRFAANQLVLHFWRRELVLAYVDIQTVRLTWWGLLIRTTGQTVILSNIHPNVVAAIYGEMEQRVPVARAILRQRFANLPIVIHARRVAPIFSLLFGIFLIAVAFGSLHYALTGEEPTSMGNRLLMLGMSLAWLGLGGGLCYAVLFGYVWRYSFTTATIHARYALRTRHWARGDVRVIKLVDEESTYRGVKRTRWWVEIQFVDGQKLVVSPSQWGAWLDNHDVQDELLLRQLVERLSTLYQASHGVTAVAPPN